jgi:hypothetical protein
MKRELLLATVLCSSLFFVPRGYALEAPAGTEMQIRLKTKVSTESSRAGDVVESILIAPVMVGGQYLIPAGAPVHGTVEKVTPPTEADERAVLKLHFDEIEIDGRKVKIATQVAGVDNAREKVDPQGQINGILASETVTSRLDAGIDKLAEKSSGLGDFLRGIKNQVLKTADTGITYDAGVEMTLRLLSALPVSRVAGSAPVANAGPIPNRDRLVDLVGRMPFQTVAQNPPKPSDITNILLIGSEDDVREAFHQAGWSVAASMSRASKFETFKALAEDRGYNEAPVSVLLLDGRPPDLVFEKVNNTFARRHHLRIWRQANLFLGKPVWAVAATHDMGINFSDADRTFIHRIDSQIDKERTKVVDDLVFTGLVQGRELVDRPSVPRHSQNATGDNLETDGKMAVLLLGE